MRERERERERGESLAMQAALDSKPFQSIALSYHHCEYFPWPPEVLKLHPVQNAQPLLSEREKRSAAIVSHLLKNP